MELNLKKAVEKIKQSDFIENFIKELTKVLETDNIKIGDEKMENIKLTPAEELEFYRKETEFLQKYFKKELSDSSKKEVFIVTNKYENDAENQRYKVAQYKDNLECKYVVFEKDLPSNVRLRDVVRKVDDKYIYDEKATQYVKNSISKIKQEIINNRD